MVQIAKETTQVGSQTLLEVKHLSVDYSAASGAVHAVTDVSFTLKRGQILGLAGESGCGKSTLAYAIARLLRPPAAITGGEILYHQPSHDNELIDILQLTPNDLRTFRWNQLAMVFQSAMNALNPVMTVGNQIIDVLRVHRQKMTTNERKERAAELLQLVGISPDRLRSYPHELSGGMRQRAIIAIALALNPELIIMDEPTTALDVVMQREILSEIIRLRELYGFSVIFITHDLSLLLELTDQVAIMYAGRIVEMATHYDLYEHPRHPYSYGLLNSFPSLHGPRREAGGIPGSPPDLRAMPSGCSFHPRCPLAFEPCSQIMPILPSPMQDATSPVVACHLYDRKLHPQDPPLPTEFAEKYNKIERNKL